jgi:APA family basic amino acid/polyamine antiporter
MVLAAVVAYANATSSAQLAAAYPEAGGTYIYGRERLGEFWGFLAGWAFLIGKSASLAAIGLTLGAYILPTQARLIGIGAVIAGTVINLLGIRKTAVVSRVVVVIVLGALGLVIWAGWTSPSGTVANISDPGGTGFRGVLQSAALLFFAFAGYARITTLGEEVIDPARTIPKAVPIALAATLVVYAAVALSALYAIGPAQLAESESPLVAAGEAGLSWAGPIVRVGASVATVGVLVSLLAGVSRTGFAMARNSELPKWLSAVHPRYRSPHRAEIAAGLIVAVLIAVVDLRGAIGFSSFAVLVYYAIANLSALTQPREQRRWPRALQVAGVAGCLLLAFSLDPSEVFTGSAALGVGAAVWAWRRTIGGDRVKA